MSTKIYTVGQLAKRCGLSTRKVRFYADQGLLSLSRTATGYRTFNDRDVVALELIRVMRAAGARLHVIRAVLRGNTSLRNVLELRLAELEAQIDHHRRVAITIRSTLKSPHPTIEDIRRVSSMLELSHAERQAIISKFVDSITKGVKFNPKWKTAVVDLCAPKLPEDASPEQIDAWLEITSLLKDDRLKKALRAQAIDTGRSMNFLRVRDEPDAYAARHSALMLRVGNAIDEGARPQTEAGQKLADEYIEFIAWNRGLSDTPDFRSYIWNMWENVGVIARLWELANILNGGVETPSREYVWIREATVDRLQRAVSL
jgi:DNA-binding transcriptional MerR regulator